MARHPLALEIERSPRGPLFLAIAEAIARDIARGRLSAGTRLPGTRALARELGVHRNTVDAAYQELLTQGWLRAEPARGTFVARDLPQGMMLASPAPVADVPPPVQPALGFSDGAPDPGLVPDKALARSFRRALMSPAFRAGSDYGDARGTLSLRQVLVSYLASDRGVVAEPERLLVTRGSQMALFLAAKAVEKIGSEIPAGVKLPVKVELEDRTVELNKTLLKKDEKAPREALDKGLETDGYISGWSQPVRVTGYVRQCVGVDAQPVPGLSLSTER